MTTTNSSYLSQAGWHKGRDFTSTETAVLSSVYFAVANLDLAAVKDHEQARAGSRAVLTHDVRRHPDHPCPECQKDAECQRTARRRER